MRRTVPVRERMTMVSVSANSPLKRTPSKSEPSVTPVAEKITSAEAMSSSLNFRLTSAMPIFCARTRCSSGKAKIKGGMNSSVLPD